MGERIQLYIKYKPYFDDRIRNHPRFRNTSIRKDKAEIAIEYISTDQTLKQIGVKYHIGAERVRQIVAQFLFTITRIYNHNRKELEEQPILQTPPANSLQEENAELKKRITELESLLAKPKSPEPPTLPVIQDEGELGYLAKDVKKYLKRKKYNEFLCWCGNRNYTGGVLDGEYYFLKRHIDEYNMIQ